MGFCTGMSGGDIVWKRRAPGGKFGTRFAMPQRVAKLERAEDGASYATFDTGGRVRGGRRVVAALLRYWRLPVEWLAAFEDAGIDYAATETGAFCKGT